MLSRYWFLLGIASSLWGGRVASAAEATLHVFGWNHLAAERFQSARPEPWLGDEPVVGRQTCPALLRFNPSTQKMESVLLRTLPEIHGQQWSFALRSGLRWWNGAPIAAKDFAKFLEVEIDQLNREYGVSHKPQVESKGASVEVRWPQQPSYSPYALAGRPLWQAVSASPLGYQCAGLYRLEPASTRDRFALKIVPGYSARFSEIQFLEHSDDAKVPSVSLSAGGPVPASSTELPRKKCDARIDLPFMTAIIWNPHSKTTASPQVRQALTHAIPRGEIMRTAAGDLGALLSAPIPRAYPGYNTQPPLRPFHLETAHNLLSAAGLKQAAVGAPRSHTDGSPMVLKIMRASGSTQELVEKMISDSFAALGVEVLFQPPSQDVQNFDGVFSGTALRGTVLDLRQALGSRPEKALPSFPFFPVNDKPLDGLLDAYLESVMAGRPSSEALSKIHVRFSELEPWTVLLSHQSCLQTNAIGLKGKVSSLDPDWFRRQILD